MLKKSIKTRRLPLCNSMNMEAGRNLDEAKRCLQDKKYDACFAIVKDYWLGAPSDAEAARVLSALMKELGHKDLSISLNAICTDEGVSNDPQLLFDAGFRLIDTRQYELASMLLKRCAETVPDDPALNYELGFVLMIQKQFTEAIFFLEKSLAHEFSFDTALNLAACFSLCRRIEDARELMKRLSNQAESSEEKEAVRQQSAILKRLDFYAGKAELDVRDWLYSLYGSILISDNKNSAGEESYESVARTMSVLASLIGTFEKKITVVEYYNLKARPLADCLGKLLDLPVENYKGPSQSGKALLVLADGKDIIGPHKSFVALTPERSMFIYSLGNEPLPVAAEIVGQVNKAKLPWDNEVDIADFKKSTNRLIDLASKTDENLAKELESTVAKLVSYYKNKKPLLLLDNTTFSERPPFTAEMP